MSQYPKKDCHILCVVTKICVESLTICAYYILLHSNDGRVWQKLAQIFERYNNQVPVKLANGTAEAEITQRWKRDSLE